MDMKKLLSLALALSMVLALAGCLKNNGDLPDLDTPPPDESDPADAQTPPDDGNDKSDDGGSSGGDKTDGEDKSDDDGDGGEEDPPEDSARKLALTPGLADALASVSADNWDVTGDSSAAEGLKNGTYDAAAVSLSDAAKLYRETGAVNVAALLTSGGWLVAEKGDAVTDMLGLGGRIVYAPEDADEAMAVLGYIAEQYGFDLGDTLIIEPTADAASQDLALLPEGGMGDGQRAALSLLEEWEYATGRELLPGTVLAVRSDLEQEPLDGLLAAVETAVSAASDTDVTEYVFVTGADELKDALEGHLELLYGVNPDVVGGSIPDDGFYR